MTTTSWAGRVRVRNGWWCVGLATCVACASAQQPPAGPFPAPASTTRHANAPYDRFTPLRAAWTVSLPSAPAGQPVLDGRHVYVALRDGTLSAFALDAGTTAWTASVEVAGPPVVAQGVVLAIGSEVVRALAAENGEERWRWSLPSPPAAAGAAIGRAIVLGLESGEVTALDLATGAPIWSRHLGARLHARPSGQGAIVLCGLGDGRVVALDAASGEPVWTYATGGPVTGLGLDGERAYVGSRDNFFYSLSVRDGRQAWRWRTGADVVGDPVFDGRRVYFSSLDNLLRALDKGNGSQQWKRPLRSRPLGGPIVVGEAVVVAGFAPEIRTHWVRDGRAVDRVATDAELAVPLVLLPRAWPGVGGLAAITSAGQLTLLVERIDPELLPFKMPIGAEVALTAPPDLQ